LLILIDIICYDLSCKDFCEIPSNVQCLCGFSVFQAKIKAAPESAAVVEVTRFELLFIGLLIVVIWFSVKKLCDIVSLGQLSPSIFF